MIGLLVKYHLANIKKNYRKGEENGKHQDGRKNSYIVYINYNTRMIYYKKGKGNYKRREEKRKKLESDYNSNYKRRTDK